MIITSALKLFMASFKKASSMGDLTSIYLREIFEKHSANIFLYNEGYERLKFQDVIRLSNEVAFLETDKKVVLCLMQNSVHSIAGYFALMISGAVPLLISHDVSKEQIDKLLEKYSVSYIWAPRETPTLKETTSNLFEWGSCILLHCENNQVAINPKLSLLLATSGSTGNPKLVKISHNNWIKNAEAIIKYLSINQDQRTITTLPAHYSYGLSVLHSHCIVGATVAVTDKSFFDKAFWSFFNGSKISTLNGVPFHYEVLKKLRFEKMELPNLKCLTQAGGSLDANTQAYFLNICNNNGLEFYSMYGQTEASPRMSYMKHTEFSFKKGCIGKPVPGGKFWLQDNDGKKITQPEKVGELVFEGPNVALGYAEKAQDLLLGDEFNGVLRTGDLATFDTNKMFYIVGRLSRFIKLFGHRVNLNDVEEMVSSLGYENACTGMDNDLRIFCCTKNNQYLDKTKREIVRFLKTSPKAVSIFAIREIPRSSSGKILYARLDPGEKFKELNHEQ